jgi:hypothetical protein
VSHFNGPRSSVPESLFEPGTAAYETAVAGLKEEPFLRDGQLWWNSLSEPARRAALQAAGPRASVADAYRQHLNEGT